MEKYIINIKTCALIKDNNRVIVIEDNKKMLINKKLSTILSKSCNYYGSSYKGRIESTKKLLNTKYKNPLLVEESNNIIFVPLRSIKHDSCIYININKVKEVKNSQILLTNNIMLTTNISGYIVKNQLLKGLYIFNIINSRKKLKFI